MNALTDGHLKGSGLNTFNLVTWKLMNLHLSAAWDWHPCCLYRELIS